MQVGTRTLLLTLFLACTVRSPVTAQPTTQSRRDAAVASAPASTRIRHEVLTAALAHGEVAVHHFAIPLANTQLSYVDLQYQTPLVEALGEHDLVLNGGYWGYRDQRRVLEGLLIVNDQRLSPAHPHGGVLEVRGGVARVVRGEEFKPAANTSLALQCSPRLIEAGKLVAKLEATKRAPRTALCVATDRGELQAYLTEARITLPELAAFLRTRGCKEALNLDGGPSTAAVGRAPEGLVTIGRGVALPYGIGFRVR